MNFFNLATVGLLFLLIPLSGQTQNLPITDFVLFGGNGTSPAGATVPASPGYVVQIGSSSSVTGGAIGSYVLVCTTGPVSLGGNVNSGGKVALANSNTVTGKVTAANSANLTGTIFSSGSSSNISGNIDVKGNVVVSGGTVSGAVTHPTGTTYTGPYPVGGNIIGVLLYLFFLYCRL
ncbi:MAG: hypothetical protein IPP71_20660 [Bacteroidetes bacterium]|nr:hypothetical protein [Bacteroidota bacterium]